MQRIRLMIAEPPAEQEHAQPGVWGKVTLSRLAGRSWHVSFICLSKVGWAGLECSQQGAGDTELALLAWQTERLREKLAEAQRQQEGR